MSLPAQGMGRKGRGCRSRLPCPLAITRADERPTRSTRRSSRPPCDDCTTYRILISRSVAHALLETAAYVAAYRGVWDYDEEPPA